MSRRNRAAITLTDADLDLIDRYRPEHRSWAAERAGAGGPYLLVPLGPRLRRRGRGCLGPFLLALLLFVLLALAAATLQRASPEGWVPSAITNTGLRGNATISSTSQAVLVGNVASEASAQALALIEQLGAARSEASAQALALIASGPLLAYELSYAAGLRELGQTERWSPVSIQIHRAQLNGPERLICATSTWDVVSVGPDGAASAPERNTSYERYTLAGNGHDMRILAIEYLNTPCGVQRS